MKKILIPLMTALLLISGCDPEKQEEFIEPVSISSFGFYAEDNSILNADFAESPIGTSITIRLPYGIESESLKTLIPRFDVTEGAEVMIDEVIIESGITPIDFSLPVDIIVTKGKANALYTVTVIISQPLSFSVVATSDIEIWDEAVMEINPADNVPYIFGGLKAEETTGKYPNLLKLSGSTLTSVAGNLLEARSDCYALDFLTDGTPYVSFKDYSEEGGQFQSVMKVTTSGPAFVGAQGVTCKAGGNSINSVALMSMAENDIYCAMYCNAAIPEVARRSMNLAHYDGTGWTNGVALPNRPADERTYIVLKRKIQDAYYLFVLNFSKASASIYKYEQGIWTVVIDDYKPKKEDGETDITTANYTYGAMDFDIAANGDIYVLMSADFKTDNADKVAALLRIDSKNLTQTIVGGIIPQITDLGNKERYMSFSLDANDVPYVVSGNTFTSAPAYMTYIDPDTKTWVDSMPIYTNETKGIQIKFAENGRGFIAFNDATTNKYVLMATPEE